MNAVHKRFAIIGGGKMGEAILSGWLASAEQPAADIASSDVVVVDPGEARRAYLSATYGVACVAHVSEVGAAFDSAQGADNAAKRPSEGGAEHADTQSAQHTANPALDVVVLSVKPQVMMGVLDDLAGLPLFQGGAAGPLFISIAAGLATDRLVGALPCGSALVRVMPNMPLMVGAGASGVCGASTASADQVRYVAGLFGCLGRAVVVDESDMDAVCALSGSGPAYVAAMIEALRDAAAKCGLDAQLAETLALQTVLGTARLIDETDLSVAEAREAVCSPGGTTLAALDAMESAGFVRVFEEGVAAAVKRSKELGLSS